MTAKDKMLLDVRCEVAYDELEKVFNELCYYKKHDLVDELFDIKKRLILFTQRLEKEV